MKCRSFDSAEVRFAQDDKVVVSRNEKQLQVLLRKRKRADAIAPPSDLCIPVS